VSGTRKPTHLDETTCRDTSDQRDCLNLKATGHRGTHRPRLTANPRVHPAHAGRASFGSLPRSFSSAELLGFTGSPNHSAEKQRLASRPGNGTSGRWLTDPQRPDQQQSPPRQGWMPSRGSPSDWNSGGSELHPLGLGTWRRHPGRAGRSAPGTGRRRAGTWPVRAHAQPGGRSTDRDPRPGAARAPWRG